MICVYVLISAKDRQRYIGSTDNLSRRLREHKQGENPSTKNRRPLALYAYQPCHDITGARQLEHRYKTSRGAYNKAIKDGILIINRGVA